MLAFQQIKKVTEATLLGASVTFFVAWQIGRVAAAQGDSERKCTS